MGNDHTSVSDVCHAPQVELRSTRSAGVLGGWDTYGGEPERRRQDEGELVGREEGPPLILFQQSRGPETKSSPTDREMWRRGRRSREDLAGGQNKGNEGRVILPRRRREEIS